jgi:hypothetical protein
LEIDPVLRAWSLIHNKNQLFSLRKLPFDLEVRDHGTCKEMLVILANRVMDKKRIIKIEGRGGGVLPSNY